MFTMGSAASLLWLSLVVALAAPIAGDRGQEVEAALSLLAWQQETHVAELIDLVGIPSISALPDHAMHILEAAQWLRERLTRAGLENVQLLQGDGPRPVVYADHLHAPGAPTALIYGHYDVQPADPLELWTSPPFKPEVRDGALYGRGASDDKGSGILPPIQAVEALLNASGGRLPINLKFMLEGEEEIGSPFLEPLLRAHAPLLACDYVLSADGGQLSATQPSLGLGLRGALAMELTVTSLRADVHSGMAGGAVQNPNRALAGLLASLHHPNGSVAVAGFYDQVQPPTPEERDDMLNFNFNDDAELVEGLGALEPFGEAGYTSLERLWHRPTLEIVGMGGGFQGEGIKTVIPYMAKAKLAARLVPGQSPDAIAQLMEDHVAAFHPPATNVLIKLLGFRAHPFTTRRDSLPNSAAAKVLEALMGAPPKYVRSGATIPAMAAFQTILGVETTTFAFGLPTNQLHAPDEHMELHMFHLARKGYVLLLHELGAQAGHKGEAAPAAHSEL